MLPIVIDFRWETTEKRTVDDVKHKRVKSNSGCRSVNLLAWLPAAKQLKCWGFLRARQCGARGKTSKFMAAHRMKFCCENEHLTVTQFWQQPPRLSVSPAVCDYPAWQSNREVICDSTIVLPEKSFTQGDGMQRSTALSVLLQNKTEDIWVGNNLTRIIKTACSECKPNGCWRAPTHVKAKTILSVFTGQFKK